MSSPVSYPTRLDPWARWAGQLLWSALWFWMGFRLAVPLFLRENLFFASAVNVLMALVFGIGFGLIGLSRPSLLRSKAGFWAFLHWLATVATSLMSPFVTEENFLRVFGMLAFSGAVAFTLVIFFNLFPPNYALVSAIRAYVLGVFLTTLTLVLMNPSALALQEAGGRFGDPEVLHPNSLGLAYGLSLISLLFLRVYRTGLLQTVLAFLMAIALLATFSKTVIAGTLVAITLAFWLLRGNQKWYLVFWLLLVSLAVTLLAGNHLIDQIQTYLDAGQAETLSGRTVLWAWVLSMAAERPFLGYGYQVIRDLSAFDPMLSSWTVSIVHAHNAYLDVLFSSGYLGLSSFALFLLYSLRLLWLGIRRLRNSPLKAYLLAVFLLLIARSFTEGALNLGFDFWMALACARALEESLKGRWVGSSHEGPSSPHLLPTARR